MVLAEALALFIWYGGGYIDYGEDDGKGGEVMHSIRFTFHDVGGGREMICRDRGGKNGRSLNHSIVVVYFFPQRR